MTDWMVEALLNFILDKLDLDNEDKLEIYELTNGEVFPEIEDYKRFKEWKEEQYWGGNEPKYTPDWETKYLKGKSE